MLFTSVTGVAQSQKDKFKEWGDIELTRLSGVEVGPATIKHQLTLKDWDKPYMWYAELNEMQYYSVPEQQAHPNFLTAGSDWGDDQMKYFMNFTSQGGGYYRQSILIIDDYLYIIDEQKDHTWKVEDMYTKESFKGVKGMLALEKKRKELAKIDHDKIVNDYINEQKKTLEEKTPAYKAANKEYYERFALEKGWANDDIKKGYEILYEQRVTNAVRIQNNTAGTVYIGFNGAGTVPDDEIEPGDEATIQCNLSDIWLLTGEHGDPVKFLFKPSEWCGKKFIIE